MPSTKRPSTTVIIARPSKRRRTNPPRNPKNTRPKRRQVATRNRQRSAVNALALHPEALAYARVLGDAFRYPPVPLGFGCMTRSQVVTLTARTFVSAGSDGSVSAYVLPSVNGSGSAVGGLYTSNSVGGAILSSTAVVWQNKGAVSSLLEEARVIACSLRLLPMVPGTATPGAAFVASLPSTNYYNLENSTKSQLILSPLFSWGFAADGATASTRPIDPNSFTFHHDVISGFGAADDCPVTVPMVIMNGIPAGETVFVEAVLHLEGIFGLGMQSQAAAGQQASSSQPTSTLTKVFNSVEHMWSAVSQLLPAPTTVRTALTLANVLLNPSSRQGRNNSQGRLAAGSGEWLN